MVFSRAKITHLQNNLHGNALHVSTLVFRRADKFQFVLLSSLRPFIKIIFFAAELNNTVNAPVPAVDIHQSRSC